MRADAEHNRERILGAARSCFAQRGVECELSVIAEEAGVSLPTLYRHFGSKTALGQAVLLHSLSRSEQAVQNALAISDPLTGFVGLLAHFVESLIPNRRLRGIEDQLLAEHEIRQRRDAVLSGAEEMLRRCQQAGRIDEDVDIADVLRLIDGLAQTADGPEQWNKPLELLIRGITARSSGANVMKVRSECDSTS